MDARLANPIGRSGDDGVQGREVKRFLDLALGLHFETRFTTETKWWPAPLEDVAAALAPQHDDLEATLDRMLEGEELASRLAVYRIARRP